jgi:hypothetical protein
MRLITTCTMQRAPDCDMVLIHDDDLATIVSRHLIGGHIVLLMLAATRNS